MTSHFTFKRHPKSTGLASIAEPYANVDIKLSNKRIGMISAPSRFGHDLWKIILFVENPQQENCPWKTATLKISFETEIEAREWLKKNQDKIQEKFSLFPQED